MHTHNACRYTYTPCITLASDCAMCGVLRNTSLLNKLPSSSITSSTTNSPVQSELPSNKISLFPKPSPNDKIGHCYIEHAAH